MELKVLNYDKSFMSSRLELNLKGKNINHIFINTIRRAAMTYIPIYSWKVEINKNNSLYNNSVMKLRLQNLPVVGIINNNIFYKKEEVKKEENNFIDDMEISVDTETKIKINKNELIMYLNYTNNNINNVTVTTNDCVFYNSFGKKINSVYKIPIPIIILQPGQTITLSCSLKLGTESISSIFSPVSIFAYEEKTNNDYNIFIESRGQITEKEILERAILNLNKELDNLNNSIVDTKLKEGSIMIQDYDHTIGNIVAYYCFNHKDVKMFSYNMPHILNKVVKFNYKLKKNTIKNVMNDSIVLLKKHLNTLMKKIKLI